MADSSVALYQTNSTDEQKHWISCINRNAALLSAAPLAAGVGSQFRFQKPLQPSHSSTLPATKQLRDQQTRLDALYTELNKVQNQQADKGSSESEVKYLEDKEAYLVWEIRKYELYTNTLDDLVALGARKFNDLQKVVEEDESRDSRSLLSISPSEPGAYFTSSSAEHFESSGDLLESSQPRSPLSPTSSLPNLIPMSVHRFPTSDASSSRISS
uniref:PH domain-containing protein n=1 Tax=Ciona savignyi TaxID=51511 RepID=H2YP51_CIOSA